MLASELSLISLVIVVVKSWVYRTGVEIIFAVIRLVPESFTVCTLCIHILCLLHYTLISFSLKFDKIYQLLRNFNCLWFPDPLSFLSKIFFSGFK